MFFWILWYGFTMADVTLYRLSTDEQGTFGVVVFNTQFLYTGELPWNDNKRNISCIPLGVYAVRVRLSPKYGKVYEIDVPGRTFILFHQGNFCGDLSRGFRTNVQGCILLGFKRGILYGQQAVLGSRPARGRFERSLEHQPFTLEVR